MRTDILEYLQEEIYIRCQSPANQFGMGCYDHIKAVVKNGAFLAETYGADKEIVMIAAWLHDIASVTDYALYAEHQLHGARIARDLLSRLGYEESKITLVQACIQNHRGSLCRDKSTMEEICVADADALSHFDNVPSLLYLAWNKHGLDLEAGISFVKDKLERSFRKCSPQSQSCCWQKYQTVMQFLSPSPD